MLSVVPGLATTREQPARLLLLSVDLWASQTCSQGVLVVAVDHRNLIVRNSCGFVAAECNIRPQPRCKKSDGTLTGIAEVFARAFPCLLRTRLIPANEPGTVARDEPDSTALSARDVMAANLALGLMLCSLICPDRL